MNGFGTLAVSQVFGPVLKRNGDVTAEDLPLEKASPADSGQAIPAAVMGSQ